MTVSHSSADVAVIGAGLSGLTAALAIADLGLDVALCADVRAGEASPAAGGILDTAHGFADPDVRALMQRARELWVPYVDMLQARTGVAIPLNRDGILELAGTLHEAEALEARRDDDGEWLDSTALAGLEPALANRLGARLVHRDGAVNPLLVLRALKQVVGTHVHVRVLQQTVATLEAGADGDAVRLTLGDGSTLSAMRVVLAAGAWAGQIAGLPRALPVTPLRGQLMSVASKALRHVVMMGAGYVIPRGDGRTILGGTENDSGFDAAHSEAGVQAIRAHAASILPSLGTAPMLNTWAGLRPMTPDGLPLIGPDPGHAGLLYACGHGRNGILLAPMTGALVAGHIKGSAQATGAAPFSPSRFFS